MTNTRAHISRFMNFFTVGIVYLAATEGVPAATNVTYALMAMSALFGAIALLGANLIVAKGFTPSIGAIESNIIDGTVWFTLAAGGWWWCLAAWTLQWFACAVVFNKVEQRDRCAIIANGMSTTADPTNE